MRKLSRKRYLINAIIFLLANLLVFNYQYDEDMNDFMNHQIRRKMSINLGGGKCKWTAPIYDPPENIDFYKTIIAGYPSGDKRLTYIQIEGLTGLSARDEWDFEYLGITNHPYIKSNYPHHEGIWGWKDVGDQVILVVRNMRRSMVEYHDILWDIGYAETYEDAFERMSNLYSERPPLEDFLEWRDLRVFDEIHWYGWFLDYWMEGGLMRDIFSNKITTPEHWYMLKKSSKFKTKDISFDKIVGNVTVSPAFDPHCVNDVSDGCRPVQIISAEKLLQISTGPEESAKIARSLQGKKGVKDYLIAEEAWGCIWTELIINKRGVKTFLDREGLTERNYNFSEEMLTEMVKELDRLINKYSSSIWIWKQTSKDLVDLLTEHRLEIQKELDEVLNGTRKLTKLDILGPTTRESQQNKSLRRLKRNIEFDFRELEDYMLKSRRERELNSSIK